MVGYLVSQYWPWLLAAFALGLVVGAATWSRGVAAGWLSGWLGWGLIGFAVCLLVALFKLMPGRWGLWLDTALWHFVAYIAGCWLGGLLRGALAGAQPAVQMSGEGLAAFAGAAAPAVVEAPQQAVSLTQTSMTQMQQQKATPNVAVVDHDRVDEAADAGADEELVSDEHKPVLLAQAKDGAPDDLKLIWGVGPKLEAMLQEMGVFHFAQIASWNEMNLRWVDQNLKAFRGRALRDKWIEQSRRLESGWRPDSEVGERPV
jgi:predicted flap endonuclease-1-like 5' DNA nuclease